MIVVVAGVSGSGKSTVGRALADRLDWEFADGDSMHPASNIALMTAGVPLADAERLPWLKAITRWMDDQITAGRPSVVACSALKRSYRRLLLAGRPSAVSPDEPGAAGQPGRAGQSGEFGEPGRVGQAGEFGELDEVGGPGRPDRVGLHNVGPHRVGPLRQLSRSGQVAMAFLLIDHELAAARLAARHGHFFDPALLDSQFADLEPPGPDETAVLPVRILPAPADAGQSAAGPAAAVSPAAGSPAAGSPAAGSPAGLAATVAEIIARLGLA
jgi:gluconate kinase